MVSPGSPSSSEGRERTDSLLHFGANQCAKQELLLMKKIPDEVVDKVIQVFCSNNIPLSVAVREVLLDYPDLKESTTTRAVSLDPRYKRNPNVKPPITQEIVDEIFRIAQAEGVKISIAVRKYKAVSGCVNTEKSLMCRLRKDSRYDRIGAGQIRNGWDSSEYTCFWSIERLIEKGYLVKG